MSRHPLGGSAPLPRRGINNFRKSGKSACAAILLAPAAGSAAIDLVWDGADLGSLGVEPSSARSQRANSLTAVSRSRIVASRGRVGRPAIGRPSDPVPSPLRPARHLRERSRLDVPGVAEAFVYKDLVKEKHALILKA
jgi:hypothetical protein